MKLSRPYTNVTLSSLSATMAGERSVLDADTQVYACHLRVMLNFF